MALPRRGNQVLDRMVQRGLGRRPILFVCHSLGGLLAKQILRASALSRDEKTETIFGRTCAVLFLATPHAGSELATRIDAFRALFGTTVTLEELRAHDAHLEELFNWYRKHSHPQVRTATYYENLPTRGFVIVTSTSAHPGVGDDPIALDSDHISISKPPKRESQVCEAVRLILRDSVLVARSTIPGARFKCFNNILL
jgi:hypothetical protein